MTVSSEPELDTTSRIGFAWRELRRGAAMQDLRCHIYGGTDQPLDSALADALDVVVRSGPVRMGDIADALRIDASTATRSVSRLIAGGLARRCETTTGDRRVVQMEPTPAGLARHELMIESWRAALDDILGVFDGAERERLAELMERLIASVDDFVARNRPNERLGD